MKQKGVILILLLCLIFSALALTLISCDDTPEDVAGITEVKVVDNELIFVYDDNTQKNFGNITSVDWDKAYKELKISNPDFPKSQSEWMSEIFEIALVVPEYTITFNTGDSGITVQSQKIKKGDKIVLPDADMSLEDYTFDGWYLGDEKWSFTEHTVTSDITLVAKWTFVQKYTVIFDTGDSIITVVPQKIKKGDKVAVPTENMSYGNRLFDGWYLGNKKWSFTDDTVTEDITLVARWTSWSQYTVTFDTGTSGIVIPSQAVKKGLKATMPNADMSYGPLYFDGWYLGNKKWSFTDDTVTEDITLVAKWIPWPEHTVTFNTGISGLVVPPQTVKKGYKVSNPNIPTIDGDYEFEGWYLNGKKWSMLEDTVTKDITLVAKWIPLPQYTVTFDTGDSGISVPSQTVKKGQKATAPTASMQYGSYNFLGWYYNGNKWSFNSNTVTDNITLVAKWGSTPDLPSEMNVLVTRYGQSASAPWGQLELNPASFGVSINQAHLDRQALILDTYGVKVNYIEAMSAQSVAGDITTALTAKDVTYEVAYPRAQEGQALVSLIYDMNQSPHLDFTKSYFSQSAYEAFTVANHTLFAAGDMDFSDNQVANMIFVNKDMLYDLDPALSATLYTQVKNGSWTYDTFKNIAKQVKGNIGDPEQGDEDIYGFSTKNVSRFFQYAGIKEADVDPDTGMYRIALDLDEDRVDQVIANIIECSTGTDWARLSWGGSYGANATVAFTEGRVLFFDEVAQQIDNIYSIDFLLGVLPVPKLNEEQENYYTPITKVQATLVCIPKCTSNRAASEFLVDVLAKTGSETIMRAYYDKIESRMDIETADADMEIVKDYIMANIMYDAGNLTCGWAGFLESVKEASFKNNTNNFTQVFGEAQEQAEMTIGAWNASWNSYYEEED